MRLSSVVALVFAICCTLSMGCGGESGKAKTTGGATGGATSTEKK